MKGVCRFSLVHHITPTLCSLPTMPPKRKKIDAETGEEIKSTNDSAATNQVLRETQLAADYARLREQIVLASGDPSGFLAPPSRHWLVQTGSGSEDDVFNELVRYIHVWSGDIGAIASAMGFHERRARILAQSMCGVAHIANFVVNDSASSRVPVAQESVSSRVPVAQESVSSRVPVAQESESITTVYPEDVWGGLSFAINALRRAIDRHDGVDLFDAATIRALKDTAEGIRLDIGYGDTVSGCLARIDELSYEIADAIIRAQQETANELKEMESTTVVPRNRPYPPIDGLMKSVHGHVAELVTLMARGLSVYKDDTEVNGVDPEFVKWASLNLDRNRGTVHASVLLDFASAIKHFVLELESIAEDAVRMLNTARDCVRELHRALPRWGMTPSAISVVTRIARQCERMGGGELLRIVRVARSDDAVVSSFLPPHTRHLLDEQWKSPRIGPTDYGVQLDNVRTRLRDEIPPAIKYCRTETKQNAFDNGSDATRRLWEKVNKCTEVCVALNPFQTYVNGQTIHMSDTRADVRRDTVDAYVDWICAITRMIQVVVDPRAAVDRPFQIDVDGVVEVPLIPTERTLRPRKQRLRLVEDMGIDDERVSASVLRNRKRLRRKTKRSYIDDGIINVSALRAEKERVRAEKERLRAEKKHARAEKKYLRLLHNLPPEDGNESEEPESDDDETDESESAGDGSSESEVYIADSDADENESSRAESTPGGGIEEAKPEEDEEDDDEEDEEDDDEEDEESGLDIGVDGDEEESDDDIGISGDGIVPAQPHRAIIDAEPVGMLDGAHVGGLRDAREYARRILRTARNDAYGQLIDYVLQSVDQIVNVLSLRERYTTSDPPALWSDIIASFNRVVIECNANNESTDELMSRAIVIFDKLDAMCHECAHDLSDRVRNEIYTGKSDAIRNRAYAASPGVSNDGDQWVGRFREHLSDICTYVDAVDNVVDVMGTTHSDDEIEYPGRYRSQAEEEEDDDDDEDERMENGATVPQADDEDEEEEDENEGEEEEEAPRQQGEEEV